MIHKALIVVLMLGAVGMALVWAVVPARTLHNPGTGSAPRMQITPLAAQRLGLSYGVFQLTQRPAGSDILELEYLPRELARLGFGILQYTTIPSTPVFCEGWLVTLPYWFVCTGMLAYPVTAFIRGPLRRRQRRRRGECVNCGYNLTGNVSGVCSECGTTLPRVRLRP